MIKPSRYLDTFRDNSDSLRSLIKLVGSALLVEKAEPEELKTSSGIVLATHLDKTQVNSIGANLPTLVRVLMVGAGYYDPDTGAAIPLETQPGSLLMVGTNSVKWLSALPGLRGYAPFTLGLVRDEETQIAWESDHSYGQTIEILSKGAQGTLSPERT